MGISCTVIMPIGPGHHELCKEALASVMAAGNAGKGPFEHVHVVCGDDTKGEIGRSRMRNICVRGPSDEPGLLIFVDSDQEVEAAFSSEWLFFLDADDLMCSPGTYGHSAFEVVKNEVEKRDAIWGLIYELSGNTISKRRQIERLTKYEAYVKYPPYITCQMGHFLRRECFEGFDEEMDTAEDVKHYLHTWREHRCIKLSEPLFINRRGQHSWALQDPDDPNRMPDGRAWSMAAEELMREARRELDR